MEEKQKFNNLLDRAIFQKRNARMTYEEKLARVKELLKALEKLDKRLIRLLK